MQNRSTTRTEFFGLIAVIITMFAFGAFAYIFAGIHFAEIGRTEDALKMGLTSGFVGVIFYVCAGALIYILGIDEGEKTTEDRQKRKEQKSAASTGVPQAQGAG